MKYGIALKQTKYSKSADMVRRMSKEEHLIEYSKMQD